MGGNAVRQFLFYHLPYFGQYHMRCLRVTVRFADITRNDPQRLLASLRDIDGNVIDSWPAVVFLLAAPSHVVLFL